MDYREAFRVKPGTRLVLADRDPGSTAEHLNKDEAREHTEKNVHRMSDLQYLLFANGHRSLLVVLQALDAGGKDGTIRHLFSGMNPQGTKVASFKVPSSTEASHDFLWRIHPHAPAKGEITIFNRSHYEDVLVVRVHNLVPEEIWGRRYDQITEFEELLTESGTKVVKFFLHISPEEQLSRFKKRLEDPTRNWKISDSDYSEREYWDDYVAAYEEALSQTSTDEAPWFVIPSNNKWFRDLAISQIICDTLDEMELSLPPTNVDLDEIRKKYHAAKEAEKNGNGPGNGNNGSRDVAQ